MRIGILSDSHDHVWNLRAALDALAPRCDLLLHAGDLCAPFVVPILATGFPGPVHAVFGNNDADRFRLERQAAAHDRVSLAGESLFETFDGCRVAVHHFPDVAEALAHSGRYDLVCTGHDHRLRVERIAKTWLVNPGSLLGWRPGGDGDVDPTFVVFDTAGERPQAWRLVDGGAEPIAAPPTEPHPGQSTS